jgi:methionine sulfoxide reductase heme-binding subunit
MVTPWRAVFGRHLLSGVLSGGLVALFWYSRLTWSEEHRLWRATGDASFVLLVAILAIGPLAKLWSPSSSLLPWRRELGIWCSLLALVHTYVTLDGWIRWDVLRFFGYEFIPQLGRHARLEPGFGLANAIGMVAIFLSLVLLATSSNWALSLLGPSAWKWLQYAAYTVFYLVTLHAFYFLFIHFTDSFHRGPAPEPNWFQYPGLALALLVPALQAIAFLKIVMRRQGARQTQDQSPPAGSRRGDDTSRARRSARRSS